MKGTVFVIAGTILNEPESFNKGYDENIADIFVSKVEELLEKWQNVDTIHTLTLQLYYGMLQGYSYSCKNKHQHILLNWIQLVNLMYISEREQQKTDILQFAQQNIVNHMDHETLQKFAKISRNFYYTFFPEQYVKSPLIRSKSSSKEILYNDKDFGIVDSLSTFTYKVYHSLTNLNFVLKKCRYNLFDNRFEEDVKKRTTDFPKELESHLINFLYFDNCKPKQLVTMLMPYYEFSLKTIIEKKKNFG
eukprot:TRINITY_DN13998_c0_g1_i1.p1 TRINITY_DN13998_c0_g1~~TRINITY_DN13998_c0_g1_i1.p1  ORF type:complete len:248 (+),score=48.87 TRINITY_DN13998_c0_g1_i1:1-744(+)